MPEKIKIAQALFGYRDGHHLVAASVTLEPRIRQFLATVTDGSGPEERDGFKEALTGLPVPDSNYYALFCTWPAPEMARPGCVWSHVLLLDIADLAQISDLNKLRSYFKRPDSISKFENIKLPLDVSVSSFDSRLSPLHDLRRLELLLRNLYEEPDQGIVILDENSKPWLDIVFNVWSQQWPKLRRTFAFSTASLADRRLSGVKFDLQIAPLASARLWRRNETPTLVVAASIPNSDSPRPIWLEIAVNDLTAAMGESVRNFLFLYGSDVEKPRRAFSSLCLAYDQLEQHPNPDFVESLKLVGRLFPNKAEALRLKESVIIPKGNLEHAAAAATFLFENIEAQAYSEVPFDHAGLASTLWEKKREWVVWLLGHMVQQDGSPAIRSFAASIAKLVKASDLREISDRHPQLAPLLVKFNPLLAFEVDTWHLPSRVQSEIIEVLKETIQNPEDWAKVVGAMFISATYVSIHTSVEKAGDAVMWGAFRWLKEEISSQSLPSQPWREALSKPAFRLLASETSLPPDSLALCAWCVQSDAVFEVLSASRPDIKALAEQVSGVVPVPLRMSTSFLLMALGLRSANEDGVRLIVHTYYSVNDSLASRNYSSDSWALLTSELPNLGWRWDWDRCEKLRRAVHQVLSQYSTEQKASIKGVDKHVFNELSSLVRVEKNDSNDFSD